MAALYDGIFTSEIHTFLVGENREAIKVHAEAITNHSKGLDVLINGRMAEANSGVTELEDVLEDTFLRFCQFAYVGDYETPAFVHSPKAEELDSASSATLSKSLPLAGEASEVAEPPGPFVVEAAPWDLEPPEPMTDEVVEAVAEDWVNWGISKKESKKHRSNSSILRQEFNDKFYKIKTAWSIIQPRCDVRGNEFSEEDYTPVFLGHAQLYVFADKWGIDALKTLTLYKLHKTLAAFKVYEARRGDIAELVKFAYSNDNTPDLEDGVDALRALVIHYVTCELESLIESPDLLALLEQRGPFSRDLVKMMMKRFE